MGNPEADAATIIAAEAKDDSTPPFETAGAALSKIDLGQHRDPFLPSQRRVDALQKDAMKQWNETVLLWGQMSRPQSPQTEPYLIGDGEADEVDPRKRHSANGKIGTVLHSHRPEDDRAWEAE